MDLTLLYEIIFEDDGSAFPLSKKQAPNPVAIPAASPSHVRDALTAGLSELGDFSSDLINVVVDLNEYSVEVIEQKKNKYNDVIHFILVRQDIVLMLRRKIADLKHQLCLKQSFIQSKGIGENVDTLRRMCNEINVLLCNKQKKLAQYQGELKDSHQTRYQLERWLRVQCPTFNLFYKDRGCGLFL